MKRELALVAIGLIVVGACARGSSQVASSPTAEPTVLEMPVGDGDEEERKYVNEYATFWGAAFACPTNEYGVESTIGESEPVPELQEPITEAEALETVRDYVRRMKLDGPIVSSELYFIERNPVLGLVTAVAAPWERGTTQPVGAYFVFEGSVLMNIDACSSFLHGPEGSE